MPSHYNRARGTEFKRRVLLHLIERGHTSARPTKPESVSEAIRLPGDVDGLPVAVCITTAKRMDFSGLLDSAQSAAEFSGKPFGVGIHSRSGRPLGEAYAVVTLDALCELLHLVPEYHPVTE